MENDPAIVREDLPSYVGFLPHVAFDPEGRVALLADNAEGIPDTLGLVWRLTVPETEGRTDADVGTLASRIDAVLCALPEGAHAQFLLRSTKDVSGILDRWSGKSVNQDPVLPELARSRRATIESMSLATPTSSFETRRFETLFSVVSAGSWAGEASVPQPEIETSGPAAEPEGSVGPAYLRDRTRMIDLGRTIESLFSQAGIHWELLGEEEIARALYERLNPARARTLGMGVPPKVAGEPIRERVAGSALALDLDEGDLRVDDVHHRVVSVIRYPERTRAGMLLRGIAGVVIDSAPELELVLSFHVLDQEKVRASFGARRRLATDQSRDAHQGPAMLPHMGELAALEQELSGGAKVVSTRLAFIVRGRTSAEAAGRAKAAVAALQSAGCRALVENVLAGTLFLTSLPLAYRSDNDRAIRRARQLLTMNLSHLAPVYGSFRGTTVATQLLLNRRGEPVGLSFFNNKEVPHAVVTGKSGAGKSVFANDLILNALRTEGRVVVLDRGGSYEKLCRIAGGVYIGYDTKKPLRINPCGSSGTDGSCPEETNAFLRDWLTEICTHGKNDLPVVQQSLLSIAVRKAFERKPGKEIVISDVHQSLIGMTTTEHPGSRDLAVCLSDYVGRGPYARFFDGPNEADFSKSPFVAIDLADAALEDSVTSVLVMAILQRVAQASKAWLSQDKYLIIDEAWTLLRSPATARFIENVSRTARKIRLSLVVLSQQLTDLEGKTGEAILAQSSYKVCLHQDVEAVRKAGALLGLNTREMELYGSLRTLPGIYSELFVKSPFGSGVARLVMDPLSYWATTSDMADRKILEDHIKKQELQGIAGREALRNALIDVSRKFPRGALKGGIQK